MEQLTLWEIPQEAGDEPQRRPRQDDTSTNRATLDALRSGLGLARPARPRRDLSALAGKWTPAARAMLTSCAAHNVPGSVPWRPLPASC